MEKLINLCVESSSFPDSVGNGCHYDTTDFDDSDKLIKDIWSNVALCQGANTDDDIIRLIILWNCLCEVDLLKGSIMMRLVCLGQHAWTEINAVDVASSFLGEHGTNSAGPTAGIQHLDRLVQGLTLASFQQDLDGAFGEGIALEIQICIIGGSPLVVESLGS